MRKKEKIFISILDNIDCGHGNGILPGFMRDLNLDQILERIQFLWADNIKELFYYFPVTEEGEMYRRAVFGDVKRAGVRKCLLDYANQMRCKKKAKQSKNEVEVDVQKKVWHLWEVYHYCSGLQNLHENLLEEELSSEGFQQFMDYLGNYLRNETFVQMKKKVYGLIGKLQNFHVVLTMENNRIVLVQEQLKGSYEKFLKESFLEHRQELRSPFATNPQLSNLEQDLLAILKRKNGVFFKELAEFYKEYAEYEDKVLLRFGEEIGFYLAFYKFEESMMAEGFSFAVPSTDKHRNMEATGLYDLALACANCRYGKGVVSNDMSYQKGECFLVVTGPNQGGKTTFARSLGSLVYFTKMGLDVPAVSANVHYFTDILTHFSVEESIETGRGKLQEELVRLAPMMKKYRKKAFVIINELFTTAANFDACIMGKRVLQRFMEQGCQGVYVTHLKELSEGDERIASLKALVEEREIEDDEVRKIWNIRKFKIVRSVAEDKGYSGDLVDKYRLTYEQLRKRMEGRTQP